MEHHNTSIVFTGTGCRARCTARNCNWVGRTHLGIISYAIAWDKARTEGRRHTADERRKAKT